MTKFTEITEMRGESKELKGVSRKNSGNDINGSKLDRWEWYGIISVKLATNYIGVNIPKSNPIQKRVVLLSLANNRLLERSTVADALGLSIDRTGKLARTLEQEDVKGILDQRQGQRQDYRFTPQIKAELIQQFVIEAVDQHPTGGEQLAKKIEERCQLSLSPRSILSHLSRLGLSSIKDSLPEHLAAVKKNSSNSSEKEPTKKH